MCNYYHNTVTIKPRSSNAQIQHTYNRNVGENTDNDGSFVVFPTPHE